MKKHSLEESEDFDEPTTDPTSFEAQVPTKKKGSNIRRLQVQYNTGGRFSLNRVHHRLFIYVYVNKCLHLYLTEF